MKKIKNGEYVYVSPNFKRKLKKEAAEKNYRSIVEYTEKLGKEESSLNEIWKKQQKKKKKEFFDFGF